LIAGKRAFSPSFSFRGENRSFSSPESRGFLMFSPVFVARFRRQFFAEKCEFFAG
jgi:hypothetical protein